MKKFTSKKKALEYVEDNIGKYDYEVVEVRGTKTILCSTGLPIEEDLIRKKIETVLVELIETAGNNPNEQEDGISFMGAQVTELIMKNSKKHLGIDILSACLDY